MNRRQITQNLKNLQPGEQFEIPTLLDIYKEMVVLRPGDCTVLVSGQHRDSQFEPWKPFINRLAPTTPVKSLNTFVSVITEASGIVRLGSYDRRDGEIHVTPIGDSHKDIKIKPISTGTGKRGRPRSTNEIKWPK